MRASKQVQVSRSVGLALAVTLVGAFAVRAEAAEGLIAQYNDGTRQVTTVVPTPHFTLGEGDSLHPAVKPIVGAAFSGTLKIAEPGKFQFTAAPATLLIDGKPVGSDPVPLAAGGHKFRLEYRRAAGPARLQVLWQSETFAPEPMPASVFEHDTTPPALAQWEEIDRGRVLAEELNCKGCHGGEVQARNARGRGPVLSNAGARLTPGWIVKWLENPATYRPNARMPFLPLSPAERQDVASYLATLVQHGYAEPGSIAPPDPSEAQAALAKAGKDLYGQIGCQACHGTGAGLVSLAAVGSKMGERVLRGYLLEPGRVDPTGRMPSLLLRESEAGALAAFLAQGRNPAFEGKVPAGDPARGKALVTSRGCIGCHAIEVDAQALTSTLAAPVWGKLRNGQGCLAPSPTGHAPRYRLSDADRRALGAYLTTGDVAPAPLVEARRTLDAFRCRACHETERPALISWKEHAPSLVDTGNKLKPAWIREVIADRRRMRHWLELRMPHFPNAVPMSEGFARIAGAPLEVPAPPSTKPDPLVLRDGVRYLGRGEEGLACINCHDYAWYKSGAATPAPDMATMAQRMRPEWFRRWLLDPARIQPGTQMPAFFVDVEKSVVERKINALWTALSLGKNMPLPEGVTPDNRAIKIAVGKTPVVFRSFVTGGGTRSLLVGLPGGQSYAFDADECRLEFAWSGEFVDARPVWEGRGGQEAVPLGDRYFVAPAGQPLRPGSADRTPKTRFKGYRLDPAGPELHYLVDDVDVRDRIRPASAGVGLVRTIELRAAKAGELWFVPGNLGSVDLVVKGGTWDGQRARVALPAGKAVRLSVELTPRKPAGHAQR